MEIEREAVAPSRPATDGSSRRSARKAVTLASLPAIERAMRRSVDGGRHTVDAAERMEDLFRSHYSAVASYVRRRVPAESADDVVAETWMVAWRRLEHVPAEPLPWLIAVARNVIATQRRGALRRSALQVRLRSATTLKVEQPSVEECGPVAAALAKLSERDREALMLTAWEGLRPAEAAAVLGESQGAFRVRLHRARRRLRSLCERQEIDEPADPRPKAKESIS